MSNFRTKLLGLAALATLFAGASYGQGITSCTAGNGVGTASVTPGPTNMRAEGTTELAGDLNFNCVNTSASATATVSIFASAPVTSQVIATATGATEATLFICTGVTTACTSAIGTAYAGTVSGTQITFSGITITAASFSGRVYNVRMNASSVTIGATLTQATEQALVSANNTSAATAATPTGFIFKSLAAPSIINAPNGGVSLPLTTYTACGGNRLPATGTLTTISFGVSVGETFGGAFKTGNGISIGAPAVGATPAIPPGEGGSYQPTPGVASTPGYAISGTKIQLVFGNVLSTETIYVPTVITNTPAAGNTLALTLVSSATSVDPVAGAAVAPSTTTGAPGAVAAAPFNSATLIEGWAGSAALTTSNGTATAVYEVSNSNPGFIQSAVVPVFVTFAPNVITTTPAAITVLESYAPTAAAAAATTVPNFAPPTNTALPATAITLCQTSLLFPFVTNQLGFDTGIVISNTSSDPFGTIPGAGTCSLNFYGSGAPNPSTNVAAPGGTQAAGTSNAFLLSAVAPGFQGYLIAQCNYQFGHGFGFLAYNLTQNNGAVEGYLALELQTRNGNFIGSEGLTQ